MRFFKNKKGDEDTISGQTIFIILMVVFAAIILISLARISRGTTLVEQTYAKKISLLIDQAKPGTYLELDVNEIFAIADKNKFERASTIKIDNEKKQVTVKATDGKGYTFTYFTNNPVLWGLNTKSGKLTIEIKQSQHLEKDDLVIETQEPSGDTIIVDKNE